MSLVAPGKSEHGRGVFALQYIHVGDLIELCETIQTEYESDLDPWIYDNEDGTGCIALGCGSLYNHSYEPNAYYEMDDDYRIRVWALKPIHTGQEIRFNYNGDPEDKTPWDFE